MPAYSRLTPSTITLPELPVDGVRDDVVAVARDHERVVATRPAVDRALDRAAGLDDERVLVVRGADQILDAGEGDAADGAGSGARELHVVSAGGPRIVSTPVPASKATGSVSAATAPSIESASAASVPVIVRLVTDVLGPARCDAVDRDDEVGAVDRDRDHVLLGGVVGGRLDGHRPGRRRRDGCDRHGVGGRGGRRRCSGLPPPPPRGAVAVVVGRGRGRGRGSRRSRRDGRRRHARDRGGRLSAGRSSARSSARRRSRPLRSRRSALRRSSSRWRRPARAKSSWVPARRPSSSRSSWRRRVGSTAVAARLSGASRRSRGGRGRGACRGRRPARPAACRSAASISARGAAVSGVSIGVAYGEPVVGGGRGRLGAVSPRGRARLVGRVDHLAGRGRRRCPRRPSRPRPGRPPTAAARRRSPRRPAKRRRRSDRPPTPERRPACPRRRARPRRDPSWRPRHRSCRPAGASTCRSPPHRTRRVLRTTVRRSRDGVPATLRAWRAGAGAGGVGACAGVETVACASGGAWSSGTTSCGKSIDGSVSCGSTTAGATVGCVSATPSGAT